jgi:hypothetical protein
MNPEFNKAKASPSGNLSNVSSTTHLPPGNPSASLSDQEKKAHADARAFLEAAVIQAGKDAHRFQQFGAACMNLAVMTQAYPCWSEVITAEASIENLRCLHEYAARTRSLLSQALTEMMAAVELEIQQREGAL